MLKGKEKAEHSRIARVLKKEKKNTHRKMANRWGDSPERETIDWKRQEIKRLTEILNKVNTDIKWNV